MCYDNDRVFNIHNKRYCEKHPQCSWNSESNVCEVCSDGQDCIQGSRDRGGGRFREGFKVGGRIKNNKSTVSSEGFVQGVYSDY